MKTTIGANFLSMRSALGRAAPPLINNKSVCCIVILCDIHCTMRSVVVFPFEGAEGGVSFRASDTYARDEDNC